MVSSSSPQPPSQQIPPLTAFQTKLNPDSPDLNRKLICFDPGETTGFAIFDHGRLKSAGQLETKDLISGSEAIISLLDKQIYTNYYDDEARESAHLVIEDYKVYGWKTEQHTWADLHTPKFIGAIVAVGVIYEVDHSMQMAHQAKQFVTDEKLEAWGLYKPGLRHARDAIRHGVYHMLFNKDHLLKN